MLLIHIFKLFIHLTFFEFYVASTRTEDRKMNMTHKVLRYSWFSARMVKWSFELCGKYHN